jgi:hypothetical protein
MRAIDMVPATAKAALYEPVIEGGIQGERGIRDDVGRVPIRKIGTGGLERQIKLQAIHACIIYGCLAPGAFQEAEDQIGAAENDQGQGDNAPQSGRLVQDEIHE